jgi:hypothetical protein
MDTKEIVMALSKKDELKFAAIRFANRILKIDIHGVRILGLQFTPKATADILNDGGDFPPTMRKNFNILLFMGVYIFLPKYA